MGQVTIYQVNPDLGRMNNVGIREAVVRDPYVEPGAGADEAGASGYGVAALLAVRFVVNPVVQSLAVSGTRQSIAQPSLHIGSTTHRAISTA